MKDPKFKVIAELRDDLSSQEKVFAQNTINTWQKKFNIVNIYNNTYCFNTNNESNNDVCAVAFFFSVLEELYAQYFSKLEFYDSFRGEISIGV